VADPEAIRRWVDGLLQARRAGADEGVVGDLECLCGAATERLGLLGATVSLIPTVGAHMIAAASTPSVRHLQEAQFGTGEGPTQHAFTTRRPVIVHDVTDQGLRTWPGWVPAAHDARAGSVYAFPLQVGATHFGVLTLYREDRLADPDLETALVFVEIATEVLLDGSLAGRGDRLEPDLGAMLDTHAHIYQAQGMVMVQLGVSLAEALAVMRAHAWANGQELAVLAAEIVAGNFRPAPDVR
jgi:hypothetical protein